MNFSGNSSEEEDTTGTNTETLKPNQRSLTLFNLCDDPDVNADANFVDEFQALLQRHQTSKLFTPFISQMKSVHQKARRSVKKRIDQKLIVSDLNTILAYSLVSSEYVCV